MLTKGTSQKDVHMAFGVTQILISVFQKLSALKFSHAQMEHIRARKGIVTHYVKAQDNVNKDTFA